MLGTIVDKIQNLFSKGFLLGAFFPVLLFVVVNAAIAFFGLAPSFNWIGVLNQWWTGLTAWQSVLTGALLIGIAVLAYLLSTFTEVFRRLLEGRYFRSWPRFMEPVRNDLNRKQNDLNGALREWAGRRRAGNAQLRQLETAKGAGNEPGVPGNTPLVTTAEVAVDAVRGLAADDPNFGNRLTAATAALDAALRANRTQEPSPAQLANAESLDILYRTIVGTEIARWTEEARRRFNGAWSDVYDNYVPDDLYPTQLGNIRAVTESYSDKTYGVNFEYLWPRLQPVILKSDKMGPLVELAKARLDFALLTLSLAIVTTVIWLVVLPIWGRSPWPFIVVGVIGPAVIGFCYLLVEESQVLFGALMQSCVDIFRLDVLPLMHQPLPDTLSAERQRWSDLQSLQGAAGTIDLRFKHPSQA